MVSMRNEQLLAETLPAPDDVRLRRGWFRP